MSAHEMQIEMQQGARQKGKVEAEFHIVIQNPVRMPSGLAVSRGGGWMWVGGWGGLAHNTPPLIFEGQLDSRVLGTLTVPGKVFFQSTIKRGSTWPQKATQPILASWACSGSKFD